jgi:hypothetical protein
MAVTLQQKRALILVLGSIVMLVLANVAWAQIAASLAHCCSFFNGF